MIKYRRHLRFALESRQPFGILPQSGRKKLDVDFAVEFNVARGLHLVHAIRAELSAISSQLSANTVSS
jgi:hypothetical protein